MPLLASKTMIYEVGDKSGVYCIEGAGLARVYFIGAPEYTLVDAGSPGNAGKILTALSQIGVPPLQVKRILVTHHHWDHVGSLWELKKRTNAEIVAHRLDADYISGKRVRRAPRHLLGRLMYATFGLLGARRVPNVEVDRLVEEGAHVGAFGVVHTPGHTPGHLCFLRDGCLFSGDLLMATPGAFQETPHIFTADVPASRASIAKVAQLDFRALLPAHHPPYTFGAAEKVRELANRLGTLA